MKYTQQIIPWHFTLSLYGLRPNKSSSNLLKEIPITIETSWVKGHSTAKVKTIQEELNILADQIAGKYATNPHPSHEPRPMHMTDPN
jgi:hypothetical protein